MSALQPLTSDAFGPRVAHGFFGRAGGISDGLYRGLNCGAGSNDDADKVAANRARVAAAMDLAPNCLLTVYQTHSPDVLAVTGPHESDTPPRADAMVTGHAGLGLAVLTADCAPVLLADEAVGIVGAAHAGWKGALGGVLENTLDAMRALGAESARIKAAIGPAISQRNYEVGAEFRERFLAQNRENQAFFTPAPREHHFQFDLPGYCKSRLNAAGVSHIDDLCICTYGDEEGYFSHRRATHRDEPDYGRNISVIVLRP